MIQVRPQQQAVDISMQEYGSIASMFDIALLNGVSITDELAAGFVLQLPTLPINKGVVAILKRPGNIPASDDVADLDFFTAGAAFVLQPAEEKKLRALPMQTMIDIALQEVGDVEDLFRLAALNGKSITERLIAGELLQTGIIDNSALAKGIAQVLQKIMNKPASDDTAFTTPTLPPGGIGFMRIRDIDLIAPNDFIVS